MRIYREICLFIVSIICVGCTHDFVASEEEPVENINRLIHRIEDALIQGRRLQGNPCFEKHLKPNLEDTISLLELHGDDFIGNTPFLLEAFLSVAPGRPDEFLLMFHWLSRMENVGGIRVIEFWEMEGGGIRVIDERYKMFSEEHDHEFYGAVPLLYWGLWVQPRESFDMRQKESAWSEVHKQDYGDWLTGLPSIFMGDPREGVRVFVSIFDVKGRESRWFPVKCVFTEADVE